MSEHSLSLSRRKALLLAGAAPMALWAGAGSAATPSNAVVFAKQIDDMITVDPGECYELSGIEIATNIYDRLLRYEAEDLNKMVGGVAESWTVSADGKVYTFKLRQGLKFASGAPITAEDCVFSLQRVVLLDKTPAFLVTQLGWTKDNVKTLIKAVDPATLEFTITVDYAPSMVLNLMTSIIASIVEKKVALAHEANGDLGNTWLKSNSAGSGAYSLVSWKPNESVTLDAYPAFRMGAPNMKRVVVRHIPEPSSQRLLLEKADADIARDLSPDQLKAMAEAKGIEIGAFKGANQFYIGMNAKYAPLANPKVRQALKYLVDYDGMVNSFLKGQMIVQQTFLPIGFFAAIPYNPYKLDVAKAKALLAEGGYPNGFEVTLSTKNSYPNTDMAQSVQQTMAQAGIKVSILPGDGKQVIGDYRARKHQMCLISWGPDYFDPHTNADTFARNTDNSDSPATKTLPWRNSWDIPEISKMTAAAARELDTKKREKLYEDLQKKVTDEGPFILMFQQNNQIAWRTNTTGFAPGITEDLNFYRTIKKT